MNQYKIVDMSNDKYIIEGISLGKNINSYFCINKNNSNSSEIIIIDTDVVSVIDGQIVFSIKNVSLEWVNDMIYSFCHLLMGNKYDLKNMKFDVRIDNLNLKKQIEEFLIKMGFYNMEKNSIKEDFVSIKDNVLIETNEKVVPPVEVKNDINKLGVVNKKNEINNSYVEMVSEFDYDMVNGASEGVEEIFENSGRVFLPMTLFIMSIFLFIASYVLYTMT